jgi:hypothetical protein
MPSKSQPWIDSYIEYAQQFTDAPSIFHRFVGLSIVGAAMGNNWKMPNHKGGFDHANLWCLLIAKSTNLHKSTSAEIGLRVAHDADVPYLASYGSPEAIAQGLMNTPYGIIYADEFSDFMKGINRDYTAGRGFFASLYDGIVAPQTFKQGSVKGSFDVAASFLSCTTMSWLTEHIKESDIEGGLLPRFLLVPAWSSDREQMDLPPSAYDMSVRQRLAMRLRGIMAQEHTCMRSEGANLIYKAWRRRVNGGSLDGTRGEAWPGRVMATCHKLSMIYHASRGNPHGKPGLITEQDMQEACDTCSEVLKNMRQILQSELAITKIEKDLQTLRRVLEKPDNQYDDQGMVLHSVALKHCHMEARHFHEVLKTAHQSDLIEFGKSKRGFPPMRWISKEAGDER